MTFPYYPGTRAVVYNGDCLDVLKTLPDASVDAVVTDPPYGLSREPDMAEVMKHWLNGDDYTHRGAGFMGKSWDSFVPGPSVWRECFRVLKPGGHLLSFAGSRTQDLMGLAIRLSGFEIRDSIGYGSGVIAWCYGSGFPKSLNVSNDERFCQCLPGVRDAATEEAAESAAQVLLADLRRGGKADASHLEDLHGVPVALHPDFALPSRTEQDLLSGVRSGGEQSQEARSSSSQRSTDHDCVRDVRHGSAAVPESGSADAGDLLLTEVRGGSEDRNAGGESVRPDGQTGSATVRPGQPGLEGRRDPQAPEGELRRPPVREVPIRTPVDGAGGRLRDGAPSGAGVVDRANALADGVREPHQSEPEGQPQGEPRTVPLERGSQARRGWPVCGGCGKPAIPRGLGTALKPAWEPIVCARKPLIGTVAQNVLEHGTGALNIDACRIATDEDRSRPVAKGLWKFDGFSTLEELERAASLGAKCPNGRDARATLERWREYQPTVSNPSGRWPTNVVMDESQAAELDEQTGVSRTNRPSSRGVGGQHGTYSAIGAQASLPYYDDEGGASRFFPVFRYQAKAPTKERPKDAGGKGHPTVKPLELMRWLVRLVTPPDGVVLEPFAGSGTTVEAALLEGFHCVAIERESEYLPLIFQRIQRVTPGLSEATA